MEEGKEQLKHVHIESHLHYTSDYGNHIVNFLAHSRAHNLKVDSCTIGEEEQNVNYPLEDLSFSCSLDVLD